jgi:trehalose 6-phosphate phosphatase
MGPTLPPPPLDRARTALFLDLDGTVAEIAPRPDDVGPEPRRTALLHELIRTMDGRVAVLTGRTLEEADRILDGAVAAVAAVHGLVRRGPGGDMVSILPSPRMPQATQALNALAQARPGLMVEEKGVSVALHYRQAPDAAAVVREAAGRLAQATGLVLQDGSMVSELRTEGPHKGDSLTALMGEAPFAGCVPVMVGDDLTDEHAFAAAAALGGYGVLVGPSRPSHARYRLDSVGGVLEWLEIEAAR